jgi:hypothetical protein
MLKRERTNNWTGPHTTPGILGLRLITNFNCMLLKIVGYPLSAGIILFLSTALMAQDAAQRAAVLTPLGYRDSAHVHRVLPGYDLTCMPDGHIRMENPATGDHIDFPKSDGAREGKAPVSDNGWITDANWLNQTGTAVSSFATTWTVPPVPSTYDGQTLFQFNSIEPNSGEAILQPVLQYGESAAGGGKYWAVASWYVSNEVFYSSLVEVNAGHSLTGVIKLTSQREKKFSYSCEFTGISGTNFSIKEIPQLTWCLEALEVYGVDQCTDFPNTPYSRMSGINVRTNSTTPSVSWGIGNLETACGVQTTIVTNGGVNAAVDIYY